MRRSITVFASLLIVLSLSITSCKKDKPDSKETDTWVYAPTTYVFEVPFKFPAPILPEDNPLTEQGILLGRMLFFDPILSGDSTLACAGCHNQSNAFTDNGKRFSVGIDGQQGTRNSMPLFNLAWSSGFFWDGRAEDLEAQSQMPVEDPLEMHGDWAENIERLQTHPDYPRRFYEAFGIYPEEINPDYAGKAMEQFMLTIVSAGSKADKILSGDRTLEFTEQEIRGIELFNDPIGADCFHCHGSIGITGGGNILFFDLNPDGQFRNNGLQDASSIEEFADQGKGAITGNLLDYGKMKVPSLRNLSYTAPYMHDGRFTTIEEVIDFYSSGLHNNVTVDGGMEFALQGGAQLSAQQKQDLIAFLMTLNDEEFLTNPDYSNPFE